MSTELRTPSPATSTAFPSGDSRPIAVLADEPETLAHRYGLRFADGVDDLDAFRYAVVDLGEGHRAWLYKHLGDPNPGTVVRVDSSISPSKARMAISYALSLDERNVLWWSS